MVEPDRRNLGERYELAQLIASGGMGQVWRGTDVLLGRPVAVKVLRSEYTGDPTFLARFRAEAQHAAALSHPNIARVFDYGEVCSADGETLAYLVMELVEGEPLSAVLRREGRLDPATTLSVLEQTAAALAEAHQVGLVHRDVKPGNILVRPDGSVKITDFGIAWSAGSVPLTRTGQVIGTPQYLSPEQAEGRHATPASDVYALGLVGYECLSGHPAFDGDNPVTIALKQLREDPEPLPGELPAGIRALITRALAKDPAARMPDGAAFVAAIERARTGRPPVDQPGDTAVGPVPVGPPPAAPADPAPGGPAARPRRAAPPPRLRRTSTLLVPLVALLLGAGAAAAVSVALSGPAPAPTTPAAQTQEDAAMVLVAADYLGRPVEDVAAQLSALGLSVQRHPEVTADAEPGTVTGVSPAGRRLEPGDDVDVSFAVAPEDDGPAPSGGGGGAGVVVVQDAGDEPVATEPSSPAAAPTSGTSTATSAAPTGTSSASASGTATGATSTASTTSSSSSSSATATPSRTTAPETATSSAGESHPDE